MSEIFILNASPIIFLGKAQLLRTISPLGDTWIIPQGVAQEVAAKRPMSFYIPDLSTHAHVREKHITTIHPSITAWDLGQGESEVLTLALQMPGTTAVLDDLQARKCAKLFNIPLIGSLGLILSAKRKGLIPLAKPHLDQLIGAGLYVDPALLNKLLAAVDECHSPEDACE